MTESMIASLEVAIFADESCLGNQFQRRANPGGAAGMMEYWTGDRWVRRDYWISEPDTTNNRMALRSAIVGLGLLRKSPCEVRFVSDSQYLVKGMTEWLEVWKARGWKRKGGRIENLELWEGVGPGGEQAPYRMDLGARSRGASTERIRRLSRDSSREGRAPPPMG